MKDERLDEWRRRSREVFTIAWPIGLMIRLVRHVFDIDGTWAYVVQLVVGAGVVVSGLAWAMTVALLRRRSAPPVAEVGGEKPTSVQTVRVAPPNSLVFVMDDRVGEIPDDCGAAPVVATSSCVVVGTLAEIDGETEVRLSGPDDFAGAEGLTMAWSGTIDTAGALEVTTSHADVLASMQLQRAGRVRVAVWTNDRHQPDVVWIVVG
ncbi:hypothetical protein [Aeromicrobium sp. Root472D3]|uniref:hypothetical protein n=1 Tax=Aeromicrobium sp. Root472D3 TaxID=1736540 RepID=UPI0006F5554E|nr:hypothetical protein [Aeromicrobium sp. Root472D3]KQX74256.1 hypothetical protein ASD10_03140 [Aeromicrobium sp. Root472D3]